MQHAVVTIVGPGIEPLADHPVLHFPDLQAVVANINKVLPSLIFV